MIPKEPLAYLTILILCIAGLIQAWAFEEGQSWPVYVWIPLLAAAFWAVWVLRDPPDPSAKSFDFNPKRGLLYFFLGFFIFPIIALINAIFGAELSLGSMTLFTLVGSVFVGIVGIFTEHVGI